jgi:Arm DNA-binding domain
MLHRLTSEFVATAPVPAKDRAFYWEGNFGLMVTAKGSKSFVVQYRAGGETRRVTLKKGLTLTEAHREARVILGAVAKGADPVGDKRKAAAAERSTLQAVCDAFLDREGPKMRSSPVWKRNLKRLVYPVLGARAVDAIKRSEIVRLAERIGDAGIVVERDGALVGDEVVGREPVLAHDDGVGRQRMKCARCHAICASLGR